LSRPSRKNRGHRNQPADGAGPQSKPCPRCAVQDTEAGESLSKRGRGRRAGLVAGGPRGEGRAMEFGLPAEAAILPTTPPRFGDKRLIPIERAPTDGEQIKPQYLERFERRAKELGIWQLDVPTEYGGGGMSTLARAVVWEELSRTIAIPARGEGITGPSARGILYSLQGEMKEKYLLPLLRGEKKACFAQTEPDAGSDPGSMRTTAVRDGDHYLINGVKRFITGAGDADFMQLMVATDRAKGSRGGISCFIVDMDAPGVKLGA